MSSPYALRHINFIQGTLNLTIRNYTEHKFNHKDETKVYILTALVKRSKSDKLVFTYLRFKSFSRILRAVRDYFTELHNPIIYLISSASLNLIMCSSSPVISLK